MPHLTFKLDRFQANLFTGDGPESGWRLRWRIAFADIWASVHLSNGKELRELPGNLFLKPIGEEIELGEAIGVIHFIEAHPGSSDGVVRPSSDHYSVELAVSAATLRDLFDLEQLGKGPPQAIVSVPGLDYGSLPDGSDKQWELGEKRNWLEVDGLTFSFPSAEPDGEDEDYVPETSGPDPTVAAISALTNKFDAMTQKFEKATPWLIAGVGAVFLAVIFR